MGRVQLQLTDVDLNGLVQLVTPGTGTGTIGGLLFGGLGIYIVVVLAGSRAEFETHVPRPAD
jgi:hypothetical protein